MYSLYANDENIIYGIKKYVADTEDDVRHLPRNLTAGSSVFVIQTSRVYVLNNEKVWVPIDINSSSSDIFWGKF